MLWNAGGMTEAELLADLGRALAATEVVVAGIRADQWPEPTPCTELDVRGVLNHLVRGNLLFAAIIGGEPRPVPGADHLGDDPLAGYQRAAARLREAFAGPGVLESVYEAPFGTGPGAGMAHVRIVEVLVHGWDLARATGQPARFPDDVAERALARSRQRLTARPQGPGAPFAAEVPVPRDAPAADRLAGFLGRPL
jgi:uncharacterized protein (TIGR03086 family)